VPHRSLAFAVIVLMLLASGSAGLALAQQRTKEQQSPSPQPISRTAFIAQMDAQFGKMDADKNGQLTRAEIEQVQKLAAVAEAEARNRALFAELDKDGNKQLSAAEFAKLVTDPPPAIAAPMLSREDGNRDGQVSLVEHRTATLANFDSIDTDKNGIVSVAEMRAGGVAPR
jgi:Ca2+-binding EF-hand superfamily protein